MIQEINVLTMRQIPGILDIEDALYHDAQWPEKAPLMAILSYTVDSDNRKQVDTLEPVQLWQSNRSICRGLKCSAVDVFTAFELICDIINAYGVANVLADHAAREKVE